MTIGVARVSGAMAAVVFYCLAVSPAAGAVVLQDQLAPTGSGNVNSQNFEPSLDTYDDLGADDFVVPAGRVWRIDKVEVSADGTGSTPAASANVFVFADGGALPGAELFQRLNVPRQAGPTYPDLSLDLTDAPILAAGRYWVGVQANLTFSPGTNNWWWRDHAPQVGMPAAWRQPGDGFGDGCTTFVVRISCPSYPTSSATPDQAFRLSGATAGARLKAMKVKARTGGKVRLRLNVPDLGTLVARSKSLKTASAEVTEIGSLVLKLKPKKSTRRALRDGQRIRAKLKLTLRPSQGDPLRAKAKAKLKP